MPKNEHQGSQQLATQVATPTVEGEGADAIESYESEVAEQVTSMPLDNAKGNPPEEQGWANALEQLGLAQLFASLDRVIEQAKAEPSIEDSLVSHVIRKQEDLRRASASYRQETTGEILAQVFVDYQDAQQAHIQLTLALQEAYYRDAQEYRWTLELPPGVSETVRFWHRFPHLFPHGAEHGSFPHTLTLVGIFP